MEGTKLGESLARAGRRFLRVFWITAAFPFLDILLKGMDAGQFVYDWESAVKALVAGTAMALAKFLRDELGLNVKVL